MTTRKELTEAIGARYRAGSGSEKQKILDELVALTGCHRKHAIRALNGERATDVEEKGRSRIYDEAARQALILQWEAADRVCGKGLKALIPMLVGASIRRSIPVEKAGTQGMELLIWLAMRPALTAGGSGVRKVHSNYHIPISNTATGVLAMATV